MRFRLIIFMATVVLGNVIKAQSFQLNLVLGASVFPENNKLSAAKIGIGLEFIPGVDERWFIQYQWDFYFPRKNSIAQELISFQTNLPTGIYTNLSFDVGHVGGQFSINRYLKNDALTPGGFYLGLGFKFDLFTAKNIQVEPYNDSLYYLYANFFGPITGAGSFSFGESDWASIGMNLNFGYLLRFKSFSFRPNITIGYYFSREDLELDIKAPNMFFGADFTIGYIFEDVNWPWGYRILKKRQTFF